MRQFLLKDEPDGNGKVSVTGKDFRYLAQVLRLQCGDVVEVRLPCGQLCRMCIIERSAGKLILQRQKGEVIADAVCAEETAGYGSSVQGGVRASSVDSALHVAEESAVWLVQCMPKAAKMDTIIRQATEAGVERIFPVISDRSVFEANADMSAKCVRWERIVREARQQSASPVQTQVSAPQPLSAMLSSIAEEIAVRKTRYATYTAACLILTEAPLARKALHQYLSSKPNVVIIAVGSEGGISPAELALFNEAGFLPLHFATNVLRTETAAIYGIAAVQTLLTEFYSWQQKE